MTIGERIQTHRKRLTMSQEELGQKLLVSRQTVSLWEKDQTVPTIDNLIRLGKIFGVSVDDILGLVDAEQGVGVLPNETYRWRFDKEELREIHRLQRKNILKRPVVFSLLCLFLLAFLFVSSAPDVLIGFAFGILFLGAISYLKGIRAYSKAWKCSAERICRSTYGVHRFALLNMCDHRRLIQRHRMYPVFPDRYMGRFQREGAMAIP